MKKKNERLEKESYDEFIGELMIYSSKTPMLTNKKKKFIILSKTY